MTDTTEPTAAIEVWARMLCAADVHVNDGDHPTWRQLPAASGRSQDDYRKAAAWLVPRMTVSAETRLSRAERQREELRAESRRRGKTVLEYSEKIRALEREVDEVRSQLGAEILRAGEAEKALRQVSAASAVVPAADRAAPVGPVCKFEEGCHRVVACDPGCGAAAADRAALSEAERAMLTYALDQAQEKIWSEDGFTDEDQAAVDSLRRLAVESAAVDRVAAETPEPETGPDRFEWIIEHCPMHGCVEPELTVCCCEVVERLRAEAEPGPCAECGHPHDVHTEGDDPVTPGSCADCDPDDDQHDFVGAQPGKDTETWHRTGGFDQHDDYRTDSPE